MAGQEVDGEARAPVVEGRDILREKLNHGLDEHMRRRRAMIFDLFV